MWISTSDPHGAAQIHQRFVSLFVLVSAGFSSYVCVCVCVFGLHVQACKCVGECTHDGWGRDPAVCPLAE